MMMIIIELEYRKQVVHNAIPYSLQTDAQPVPEQCPPQPAFLTVYILSKKSHGVEYPFGQLCPAVPSVTFPSFLFPSTHWLVGPWEKQKRL